MSLLKVNNLKTSFFTPLGEVKAVNGVSYEVERGKTLGIVGESGSGKSVSAYSVMKILADAGKIVDGTIEYDGKELVTLKENEMYKIRGNKISIIFQDPMTSLNPVFTIGNQLMEAIMLHTNRNRKQAKERAVEMLKLVGVNEPEKRIKQYPHEFSGGMRQRVMIAIALACQPKLLIADEPTTALDVTIQADIIDLLKDLQKQLNMAVILITHDLGIVADVAKKIVVMYSGKVVETGSNTDIFYRAKHPYTQALLRAVPRLDADENQELESIEGTPPNLIAPPVGCPFSTRCKECMKICQTHEPPEFEFEDGHTCKCWLYHELCQGTKEA